MQTNLTLSQPYLNCVYQRDNAGYAKIPVVGTAPAGTINVVAVFTAVNGGITTTQTLPVDKDGNIASTVELPGGLYSLVVWAGTLQASVNRVGAGEVFVLFGHSFISGGHDKTNQRPATDERVMTLLDTLDTTENRFGKLTSRVGPFGEWPECWGQLGDLLVKRLNVPVLFYGAAYGGSNVLQSYQLLNGLTRTQLPPGTTDPASRQPFLPLETVFTKYIPKTGIRAVLTEHGYNDRESGKEVFKMQFRWLLNYIRTTFNRPALAFMLVQEETINVAGRLAAPEIGVGIQEMLSDTNIYKGPDFNADVYNTPGFIGPSSHLAGGGIDQFGKDWDAALTPGFFSQSTPYAPTSLPDDILPAVLYNAPMSAVKSVDWAIIGLAAIVLVALLFWKNKYLIWAFLLLGLIALGRVTGKV